MVSLKSYIGQSSGEIREEIDLNRIQSFCKAVSIEETSIAPPTFLTLFRKGEFDLFQKLGLNLANILHAEQEYTYENPIQAGDSVTFDTAVTQVLEKQGSSSSMQFITFETNFYTERQSKNCFVGKSKTTIVVREKA